MMKKGFLALLVLAVAMSASSAWAGRGKNTRACTLKQDQLCAQDQTRLQTRQHLGASGAYSYGPGDGTGYQGEGPRDGTGYGFKKGLGSGTGTCDGTGPHGQATRGRRINPPDR